MACIFGFYLDETKQQPVFSGDLYLYGAANDSSEYKAIVGSPTRPNQYGYGSPFTGLENGKLQNLLYVGGGITAQGENKYHTSGYKSNNIFDGTYVSITENEYNQYLQGITEITFDTISAYTPAEQVVLGQFYDVPEDA